MEKTIGVFSVDNNRSLRDMEMLNSFKCNGSTLENFTNSQLDSFGVLGTNINERSVKDRELLSTFRCNMDNISGTESFTLEPKAGVTGDMLYFPRSVRDREMLSTFNTGCAQVENYCGSANNMNSGMNNPYNTSRNIKFLPLK